MQCNKLYIMTTMILFFYHNILAILHVTGLKIGGNVKQQTWYLIEEEKKKKTRLFDIGYAVLQYAIFIIIFDQCRETPIKTQGR